MRTFRLNPGDQGAWVAILDDDGTPLAGIRGRSGAGGVTLHGDAIGADLIEMTPGSAFPLHVHPGDHVLAVLSGEGFVHVDGVDHPIGPGDTLFIPAELPHGVFTGPDVSLRFLAVGVPHRPLDSSDRMRRVAGA